MLGHAIALLGLGGMLGATCRKGLMSYTITSAFLIRKVLRIVVWELVNSSWGHFLATILVCCSNWLHWLNPIAFKHGRPATHAWLAPFLWSFIHIRQLEFDDLIIVVISVVVVLRLVRPRICRCCSFIELRILLSRIFSSRCLVWITCDTLTATAFLLYHLCRSLKLV